MAAHIQGPLYYERVGRAGPIMAFVHPNPMDQSCWMFQMAHFSTWYRCMAIDLPGYGRSPKADAGLTMADVAEACWEAIDDAFAGVIEPSFLNAVFRDFIFSTSRRAGSSSVSTSVTVFFLPNTSTGTISSFKTPDAIAFCARS